jgi:predicted RND superfamily exporter protein
MIDGIFRHKKWILAAFAVMLALSAFLAPHVRVNYNLLDYLPADSPSTVALNKINEVFGETNDGGLRVMASAASILGAVELKGQLSSLEGVESVRWLDDAADITLPVSFIDSAILAQWYREGYALYKVQLVGDETGKETSAALDRIRAVIGPDGAMAGGAVNNVAAKQNTGDELKTMMTLLIPFLILIMLLSTTSWLEPVLFLLVIGAAVLFNTATNVFLGKISFVTQTAAAVLQLAVSMDYSIFLLHRFRDFRQEGLEPLSAMKSAMKSAYPTILASGLTTIFGFAALILMRFLIGADMGLVLAKGVVFSLLSVIFLLPVLTMLAYKLIDKTTHRNFMPSFKKTGRLVTRVGIPLIVLMLVAVVPSYLAQQHNSFLYGESTITGDADSQAGRDDQAITELFGASNQLV